MPPRSNRPQQGDTRQLQFLDLDDFSPGIYSNSDIAFSTPPNTVPGPFAAQSGAADASQTWQCIALAGGGLGPLPGVVGSFTLAELGITSPPVAGYVAGLINTLVDIQDEFVVFMEWATGGNNYVDVWSGVRGTGVGNSLYTDNQASAAGGGIGGAPFMFATRVAPSNPTTTIGQLVIAIPYYNVGDILLYPDPSAPTSFGVYDFSATNANTIFGHQSRIVSLENVTLSWPAPASLNTNNDAINYTDPPNSETYPALTPGIIFVAEQPYGYGAWGSISAGELFLVKCRGGGVVVSGDINNPTVTFLPGVRPTGAIAGHADSNEAGLFYCVYNGGTIEPGGGGAHLWGGGNVSQKISNQLDDNFFVVTNPILSRQFSYFCKRWSSYMMFSNNWLFDQGTNSWWRFLNPSIASCYWIADGFQDNMFYSAITEVASDATVFLYQFDKTIPASSWQWQSLPIRVTEDRYVDLREVYVRYSNPYGGTGSFTMQVSAIDQAGNVINAEPFTWNSAVNRPQPQRFNIRCQSEDITVRIAVQANTAGQPAPVVHSLSFGYHGRQHAGATL